MEIHRDTVSDVIEDLARHAREVTDYLITNVGLTQIQLDEMWSFVKKKSLLLEMQGDVGRSSRSLPVLHQFYPNPFRIDDKNSYGDQKHREDTMHGRGNY
jgi:hypothetical protein